MDVVLGVAVTGQVARLALIEAARGSAVIDQSTVELTNNPVADLSETIVGTNRLLTDEGHRLVGTRLVWSDQYAANQLQQALNYAGVANVEVVSESQAATALLAPGRAGAAVLLVGSQTASLAVPSGDPDAPPTVLAATPVEGDAGATFDTLMAQVPGHAGTPDDVLLVGTSPENTAMFADQLQSASTMSVQIPGDPEFALARGAAADATMAVPTASPDATMAAPFANPDATMAAPAASPDATMAAPSLHDATMAAPIPGDGGGANFHSGVSSGDPNVAGDPNATAYFHSGASSGDPAAPGDATAFMQPADGGAPSSGDEQLAYSQASEYDILPVDTDGFDDYGDEYGDEYEDGLDPDDPETAGIRPQLRRLLISNAVIGFAVLGFASLAVAVAVTVRPTASTLPVEGHQNAQPGKFMPLLPTEQQAPVPPPPPDIPTLGFQGGTVPAVQNVPRPAPVAPAPAPAPVPAAPVPVPVPAPLPVPIFIPPYPGWQPPYPGWQPPYPGWQPGMPTTPPTTAPTTPVTTPPTTAPTTPPTTAPTTPPTTAPTTPVTTPPTTQPTTPATTQPPKTTTIPPTTVAPTTEAPTTVAPPPTTVAPQPTQEVPTQAPTQQVPTQAPTQQVPTQQQTVAPPPTQAPRTQAPVPQAPQTQAPVPQVPRTQAPVPQAPRMPTVAPRAPSGGGSSGGGSSGGGSSGGGGRGGSFPSWPR